jgi:ABC-2 type transport system ATP-binding protein
MGESINAIEISDLKCNYGKLNAVQGLSLTVKQGTCYGFFGPNGAGKTTTIKCILNHMRPASGEIRVFGLNTRRDEVKVKSHIGYVPEFTAFYSWMTARGVLDYTASFYPSWNRSVEKELLERLNLDASKKVSQMSKGMKVKLSLICAIAPEPDLLLLDEPTTGLDPLVRKELIETVIGAYQDRNPEKHTLFISTHMLQEFEGLIDEFTIVNQGRECLRANAEEARERHRKIRATFSGEPPHLSHPDIIHTTRSGRQVEWVTSNCSSELSSAIHSLSPETYIEENLTLEEIFICHVQSKDGEL